MLSAVVGLALIGLQQEAPATTLSRVFRAGDVFSYSAQSQLLVEQRQIGLNTFVPQELFLKYGFTARIIALKPEGICQMRYDRPTITQIDGETFASAPRTTVEKVNMKLMLEVSPINEILSIQDLTKTLPKKKPVKLLFSSGGASAQEQYPFIGQFIGELYRLALFVGSLDSSLDFNPRMPLDPVKPGDTWKRTVGYSPQKLAGEEKVTPQRLDYTYEYKGRVQSGGRSVERVEATLKLDTDLAQFVNPLLGEHAEEVGLKSVPMKMDAKILFDLDPKTFDTLKAVATSQGSLSISIKQETEPIMEQRLKGETVLTLVSKKRATK